MQVDNSWGEGLAQWLERWTRDRKVPGSSPGRSGGRIFFSRVSFLCWLLFWYLFRPRVTAVARNRSRSFCQKCRWQVTTKHTYTLPMWLWMKWHCKLVHGWVVYTELAPRRQQFHVAPVMQQPKRAISTPFPWVLILRTVKRLQPLIQNRMRQVRRVSSRAEKSTLWKIGILIMVSRSKKHSTKDRNTNNGVKIQKALYER